MRRESLVLAFAGLLVAGSAAAEEPAAPAPERAAASSASAWDESHMQSRYQATPPSTRPKLTGESGYGALASGSSETRTVVPEAIEYTSQRQWVQGALSTSTQASGAATSESSSSSGISRASTLRGSVHSRR
jgi:hypothetical protein